MFLINFFKDAWNKAINPAIGLIWHVIGGAVTGGILPTLAQSALANGITKASVASTVVSGLIGAIVGYAQHSNNKAVASLAGQITPTIQNQIDQKVTDAVVKAVTPVAKVGLFLLVLLTASVAMANPFGTVPAEGVDVQGLALNLNFNAPTEFVQTAGNVYKLLPSAGFSLSWGWEDVFVTPNGAGDDTEIQSGVGLCLQGNYGTEAQGNNTVSNSVLGLQATYQGFNFMAGLQIAGDPLGGPGSSGVVFGASYALDALINFNGLFLKTSK